MSASSWESEHQWSSKSEMWRSETGKTRVHFWVGWAYCFLFRPAHSWKRKGGTVHATGTAINWACGWKIRRGHSSLGMYWVGATKKIFKWRYLLDSRYMWAWVYMWNPLTKGFSTRKTIKGELFLSNSLWCLIKTHFMTICHRSCQNKLTANDYRLCPLLIAFLISGGPGIPWVCPGEQFEVRVRMKYDQRQLACGQTFEQG